MLRWKVKHVADERAISMRQLVRLSGVSYKTMKAIYQNPYHAGKVTTLYKLADALNVSCSALIEQVPPASERNCNDGEI